MSDPISAVEPYEQPKTQCPRCLAWVEDFDGFGVLAHTKDAYPDGCGYCSHPSLTGGVCGICGARPETAATGDVATAAMATVKGSVAEKKSVVRLRLGRTARDFKLEVDGQEVRRVRSITIRAAVHEVASVEVVTLPEGVEVEASGVVVRRLEPGGGDFTAEEISKHQQERSGVCDAACRLCRGFALLALARERGQ